MQAGKILVGQYQGAFVIKLVGDVRLTLCTTIDDYFNQMFGGPDFVGVVIDLSEAEGIDSTSLGLLAKLAIQAKQLYQLIPMVVSPNPNISRLLTSMGFDKVFDICESAEKSAKGELSELAVVCGDENCVRSKIIEAHRILMNLNEENRQAFSALVTTLEASP